MKMEDYLKGEFAAVRTCSSRGVCPLGALCERMANDEGERPLFPTVLSVERGQLLWTSPYNEQKVYIIKSGIFSCVANLEQDNEVPFALFGRGYAVGLNELYIPRAIGSTYYLRALSDGTVCSLPAKPLRRQIESCPPAYALGVMTAVLTNISSASYAHARAVSRPLLSERLAMVFVRLRELAAREQWDLTEVHLTHEELATLVMSDRPSVTRALRKMEADGLIELGYRSVKLSAALDGLGTLCGDARAQFHGVPELAEG